MTSFTSFKTKLSLFIKRKTQRRGFEILPHFTHHFQEGRVKSPYRSTTDAAGYDISSIGHYEIQPGEKAIINTGLTSYMKKGEWLGLFVRSGLAYKKDLTLQNATGVVDGDFYGNQIRILLRNEGTEVFVVNYGDRIAQGIFLPYLPADNDRQNEKAARVAGFGSTGVSSK